MNQIKNRIRFRIKTGYYLELLRPQTMKLNTLFVLAFEDDAQRTSNKDTIFQL